MKTRFILILTLLLGWKGAFAAPPALQTQTELRALTARLFSALSARDEAKARALWLPKSSDADSLTGWMKDWKKTEKSRIYTLGAFSGWQKWDDSDALRVRFRFAKTLRVTPKNGASWTDTRDWIVVCRRVGNAWKFQEFWPRDADFHQQLGAKTTPSERQNFLDNEWGHEPPVLQPLSDSEAKMARAAVERLLDSYRKQDARAFAALWHPRARDLAAQKSGFPAEVRGRQFGVSDVAVRWARKRIQAGQTVLKFTARFNWNWVTKSDGKPHSLFTEWRLTLLPSARPQFLDRVSIYNSYLSAIEDASVTQRGLMWEDDWEIARAALARPPADKLKTLARARIEALLNDFSKQDLSGIKAQWTGEKTAAFVDFARQDFTEGDQTRFENLKFEHWKQFQDDAGTALQVRVKLDWSWRDLPLKDPPQNGRSSTSQYWIFLLRPDAENSNLKTPNAPKTENWKISRRWARHLSLFRALKLQSTPDNWAEILGEQHEWERIAAPASNQIVAGKIPVDALLRAVREGDVAAGNELWKRNLWVGYDKDVEVFSSSRRNSQIRVESENWTRLEDRDSAAPPRLRVRLVLHWNWEDEDKKPQFAHENWDLWLEPDDDKELQWHLMDWRRSDVDLKTNLLSEATFYKAWILDGERENLDDAGLDELNHWIFALMSKNPMQARNAVLGLQTGALLEKNAPQHAYALVLSNQIETEYFFAEKDATAVVDDAYRVVEAAEVLVREGDLPGATRVFRRVGSLAGQAKDSAAARTMHQLALDFARKTGEIAPQIDLLNDLGADCEGLGLLDEAAAHYQAAVALSKTENDLERELGARVNAAVLRANRGEIGPALREILACRAEAAQAKLPVAQGDHNLIIGQLYAVTGQTDEAISAYQNALRAAEKADDSLGQLNVIALLTNIYVKRFLTRGTLDSKDPDLDGVTAMMTKSREISSRMAEAKFPPSRSFERQIAVTLLSQVEFFLEWNRAESGVNNPARKNILLDAAQSSLEGRAEKMRRISAPDVQFNCLINESELLRQQKKWPEALAAQENAAKIIKGDFSFSRTQSAQQRGDILRDMNRLGEATQAYREALSFLEARRAGAQDKLLQSGVTQNNIEIYQKLADCLQKQNAPGDEILAAVEGARARSLTEMMSQGANQAQSGLSSAQKTRETRLTRGVAQLQLKLDSLSGGQNQAQVALLKTLRSGGGVTEDTAELRQKLTDSRRELEAFRREIFLQNPALQTKRAQWTPPTLAQIGARLFKNRPGRRIVSFVVGDEATMLLVFSPGAENGGAARLETFSIAVSRSEFIKKVAIIRRARSRASNISDDFSFTYSLLFGPIARQLNGATELIIIPDGPLGALPFVALNDEDGTFLLEKYQISYAPGIAALIEMEKMQARRQSDEIAAKRLPFLGLSRSEFPEIGLKSLPGTSAELDAIAPLFGTDALIAQDAKATKAFARQMLPRARFIHLATHGLLNQAAPLYSSVALSPDKSDPDGRLYARDLMNLDLHADLVVLSACETALGQEVRGEGVLGLTWALFIAGAPASVVTQWSVDDAATSTLMPIFYRGLKAGQSPAEAMRNAQLALLKSKTMRHPAYWAPFIVVGAGS